MHVSSDIILFILTSNMVLLYSFLKRIDILSYLDVHGSSPADGIAAPAAADMVHLLHEADVLYRIVK